MFVRDLATLFFLSIALLQLNDPDPAYWIVTYALTGVCAQGSRLAKLLRPAVWATSGLVLVGLLQSLPGFIQFISLGDWYLLTGTMSKSQPQIEFAREFIGLLFCLMCLVIVIIQNALLSSKKS